MEGQLTEPAPEYFVWLPSRGLLRDDVEVELREALGFREQTLAQSAGTRRRIRP
jgi:hypothetical protein